MIPPNFRSALIIGHPAHGLRVHRFLEIYKPVFYIMTDGSGSKGNSKSDNAIEIIEHCGAKASPVICRFSDQEMYRIIKEYDIEAIRNLVNEIVEDLEKNEIDFIAGDSLEGFNPTHDLCRYLVNAVVKIYSHKRGKQTGNYDFLLHGPPDLCPPELVDESIWLKLEKEEFDRKMAVVRNYPEITVDIEYAFNHYGEDAFHIECLRPVKNLNQYTAWNTDVPFYESYGIQKVKDGIYKEIISFEKHLLPLAKFLAKYADDATN
jgi:hypothetical protein